MRLCHVLRFRNINKLKKQNINVMRKRKRRRHLFFRGVGERIQTRSFHHYYLLRLSYNKINKNTNIYLQQTESNVRFDSVVVF